MFFKQHFARCTCIRLDFSSLPSALSFSLWRRLFSPQPASTVNLSVHSSSRGALTVTLVILSPLSVRCVGQFFPPHSQSMEKEKYRSRDMNVLYLFLFLVFLPLFQWSLSPHVSCMKCISSQSYTWRARKRARESHLYLALACTSPSTSNCK